MIAMRMMKVAIDQVIHVVSMRNCGVPTVRAMNVLRIVPAAVVVRRTAVRICRVRIQYMLIDVIAMNMVQMTVMQVIDMPIVLDRNVTTARSMLMVVVLVLDTGTHGVQSSFIKFVIESPIVSRSSRDVKLGKSSKPDEESMPNLQIPTSALEQSAFPSRGFSYSKAGHSVRSKDWKNCGMC